MSNSAQSSQYHETFITALQWMWGDGYLSPGGPAEVEVLLEGVNVKGCDVLDIGSGLGAITVLLAQTYGAKSVVGIDVEPQLIEHSIERAAQANLQQRVQFTLVEPGPLLFADNTFNLVFSKDSIIHIPDKPTFYKDVLRVLKPGGVFVGSDWLRDGSGEPSPLAKQWLDVVGLKFQMKNLEQTRQAIEQAGFKQVRMNDRNELYRDEIKQELAILSGDKFDKLVRLIGSDAANHRLESSTLRQQVLEQGFLRPTHFVGYKPR